MQTRPANRDGDVLHTSDDARTRSAREPSGVSNRGANALERPLWQVVGLPAVLSCVALWAASPPLGWSFVAWVAPLGLLHLIARDQLIPHDSLEQPLLKRERRRLLRRAYFQMWLAGCVFWLSILQGIRLAFWPLYFGWLAMALYLAIYIPLFVGVGRVLHHRWKWPLCLAAPVAWTGLELWRSYLLTGYAASSLAHTQYQHPTVIQLADQLGGYGVSFVIMATSVAMYRIMMSSRTRTMPTHGLDLALPACLLFGMIGYGVYRLREADGLAAQREPLLRVLLMQENTPSMFDATPDRLIDAWNAYMQITSQALQEVGPVDLVVWPESTFSAMIPWLENKTVEKVPDELKRLNYDRRALQERTQETQLEFSRKVQRFQQSMREALLIAGQRPASAAVTPPVNAGRELPYALVGNDFLVVDDERYRNYNAALLIDPQGRMADHYEKVHLVMFGEYIPLPWLLGVLGSAFNFHSATPGTVARAMEVNGVTLCPSICFESMLPQVMFWQMRSLVAEGKSPDVLVCVTNDSWFRGSSMLDHHLASEVMTAVEMRRPFLVAANTGLSAWIDGSGRIVKQTERLKPGYVLATCKQDSRFGMTQRWGDLPAWCLAIVCALALFGNYRRRQS